MVPDFIVLTALAAAAIRIAIVQHQLRMLEQRAVTDPLTGAFNRRHLDGVLAAAVDRRRRSGERASLLLFDIDGFKDINDALGHAAGDRVLKSVVALAGERIRKLDALFRIGGEEFAMVLSGTRFIDALLVAEDLRGIVQDADLVAGHSVSISLGVAELGLDQSVPDWMAEADAALYRAKRAGRNRVGGRYHGHLLAAREVPRGA
jgi:diguanylate cyclase (GGDEF)-like protein